MTSPRHPACLNRRQTIAGLASAAVLVDAGGAHAQGQPKRGGRIRVASTSSSTSDTLDPAKGSTSTDYARHYMIYSGLTRYDDALDAQPALAESLESDDLITWRVRLRRGVRFHDGKPLTSADVVYSLLRHKDPATASKMAEIAEQFADITADGPHELRIRLTAANVGLPQILAASHFLIVADGTREFRTANGTGPYRCSAFQPGVRTIGVRNEDYWREGRPYLDQIELIGIPDQVARVNALLAGDVHLINAVDPHSTRRVRASAGHAVMETPSGLYTNLIMRQDALPTSNPDFVLAIKHLFDRDLIRRALFRNYAVVANDHPIPPFHRYYRDDLPQRTLDLDRAAFHLRRAGLTGVRLPVFASQAANGSVDMASVLQEYAARVGLRLSVNRVPADGYWSTHWMRHPMTFGNVNPRPTADLLFSLFFASNAPWNESGWRNSRFDGLLIAARSERDEARRRMFYGDMQELVRDQCGLAIPVFMSLLDGHDLRLKGLSPVPIGGLGGYNFADEVWWDD